MDARTAKATDTETNPIMGAQDADPTRNVTPVESIRSEELGPPVLLVRETRANVVRCCSLCRLLRRKGVAAVRPEVSRTPSGGPGLPRTNGRALALARLLQMSGDTGPPR